MAEKVYLNTQATELRKVYMKGIEIGMRIACRTPNMAEFMVPLKMQEIENRAKELNPIPKEDPTEVTEADDQC